MKTIDAQYLYFSCKLNAGKMKRIRPKTNYEPENSLFYYFALTFSQRFEWPRTFDTFRIYLHSDRNPSKEPSAGIPRCKVWIRVWSWSSTSTQRSLVHSVVICRTWPRYFINVADKPKILALLSRILSKPIQGLCEWTATLRRWKLELPAIFVWNARHSLFDHIFSTPIARRKPCFSNSTKEYRSFCKQNLQFD